MKKKERAALIKKILDKMYPSPPIPLDHKDPYTLLVAVLLSAQCTDARVNKTTPILFKKANTPKKMAKLSLETIKEIVRPCGLGPQKARAISELSKILVEKHKGKVPDTFEGLEALPGVGHKTASAVMAHAFHTPAFPVDTHVHRCAKRWGLSSGKNVKQTEKDLKALYDPKDWIKLHLQIIYCGREHCTAKNHSKANCPICSKLYPVDSLAALP